jgi:hypothetical protein
LDALWHSKQCVSSNGRTDFSKNSSFAGSIAFVDAGVFGSVEATAPEAVDQPVIAVSAMQVLPNLRNVRHIVRMNAEELMR